MLNHNLTSWMQVVLSATSSRLYGVLGDFHLCPLTHWCKTFY